MTTPMNGRPFTERIRFLKTSKNLRYADLEGSSDRARSTAWFNNLLNSRGPWVVGPPTSGTFTGLARLMETTESHIKEMVAEEWYGVRRSEVSDRVASLAPRIDVLSEEDVQLLEAVLQRLQPPEQTEDLAESGGLG